LIADEHIDIKVLTANNEYLMVDIEKGYDEDLGLEFENSIMDKPKRCNNKCIFCFMDQMPPNMRESLYFKDDDYRISFLHGNFITLTNVSDEEMKRIADLKLSPLYVSVHTTNPSLRIKMMNNPNAGDIQGQLKTLVNNGIQIHCQIVLCPGINDKGELDKTIKDLSTLWPGIKSVAVVPVGLTKYRNGLFPIRAVNESDALQVIRQVEGWQQKFKKKFRYNFVFAADEFYLTAGKEVPAYDSYEDFPQLENGVGLISIFKKEFESIKIDLPKDLEFYKELTVVTGVLAEKLMRGIIDELNRINNLKVNLYPVKNNFFGDNITVVGLIVGRDIIDQLKDKSLGSEIIIPEVMLKEGEDVFLDDISPVQVEKELGAKVKISRVCAKDFIEKILEH
jgi:putative radical SAM enzyme (TIGR03279 family)